jgi:hypothetical protein
MTRPEPLPPRRPRRIFDGHYAGIYREPGMPRPSRAALGLFWVMVLLVAALIGGLFLWGHSRETPAERGSLPAVTRTVTTGAGGIS